MTEDENKQTLSNIVDAIAKLSTIVETVASKAGMLPGGGNKSESTNDRVSQERAKRKADAEKAQQAREMSQAARDAAKNYANPVRKEEAQARFKELRSPARAAGKPSVPASSPGEGIDFYVYKDGEIGTISLIIEGGFTPL
jgi:O-methyltransferase involved in polyketide biosynthesis